MEKVGTLFLFPALWGWGWGVISAWLPPPLQWGGGMEKGSNMGLSLDRRRHLGMVMSLEHFGGSTRPAWMEKGEMA